MVVTFGPDGITGHPDHVTIGRATAAAFLRLPATAAQGCADSPTGRFASR